jgi:gliding motility-associated-like protein
LSVLLAVQKSTNVVNATECCELFIPNAFSPNNDGTNDRFTVIPNGHLRRFSMQLFNRWGQLIFATNDKHASWDGTYLGAAADAGTYFYIITADCLIDKELMRKGDVLLIR